MRSVPEIHEADGHGKIVRLDGGNNTLEIVPALAGDSHLLALDLGGDLEFGIPDEGSDLLGHDRLEAFFYFDDLPRVAEWGDVGFGVLHIFQADAPFGELAGNH